MRFVETSNKQVLKDNCLVKSTRTNAIHKSHCKQSPHHNEEKEKRKTKQTNKQKNITNKQQHTPHESTIIYLSGALDSGFRAGTTQNAVCWLSDRPGIKNT